MKIVDVYKKVILAQFFCYILFFLIYLFTPVEEDDQDISILASIFGTDAKIGI